MGRAEIYTQLKLWEKARHDYRQALTQEPSSGAGHMGLAECLAEMGEKKAALEEYKKAIEADGTVKIVVLEKRRDLLRKMHDYAGALRDNDEVAILPILI